MERYITFQINKFHEIKSSMKVQYQMFQSIFKRILLLCPSLALTNFLIKNCFKMLMRLEQRAVHKSDFLMTHKASSSQIQTEQLLSHYQSHIDSGFQLVNRYGIIWNIVVLWNSSIPTIMAYIYIIF